MTVKVLGKFSQAHPLKALAIRATLLVCLLALCNSVSFAADIVYTFTDFQTSPGAVKSVELKPLNFPTRYGTNIVSRDARSLVTGTNGVVTFTNVNAAGCYQVTFKGKADSVFTNCFSADDLTNATLYAYSFVTNQVFGITGSWSSTVSDARYVRSTNGTGTGLSISNLTLKGATGSTTTTGYVWTASTTNGLGDWAAAAAGVDTNQLVGTNDYRLTNARPADATQIGVNNSKLDVGGDISETLGINTAIQSALDGKLGAVGGSGTDISISNVTFTGTFNANVDGHFAASVDAPFISADEIDANTFVGEFHGDVESGAISADGVSANIFSGGTFDGDGSGLTNLNATNLFGKIPQGSLATNNQFSGAFLDSDGTNRRWTKNGNALTNLNAANLTGTQANGTESTNTALKNAANTFTAAQTINNSTLSVTNSTSTNSIAANTATLGLLVLSNAMINVSDSSKALVLQAPVNKVVTLGDVNGAVVTANFGNKFFGPPSGSLINLGLDVATWWKNGYISNLVAAFVFATNTITATNGFITKAQINSTAASAFNWTSNNLYCGMVKVSASAGSFTLTNAVATANSIVAWEIASNDSTAAKKNYVASSGLITFTFAAAPTADCNVSWQILSP